MTKLFERILWLCSAMNTTMHAIEIGAGIPVNTIRKWETKKPSWEKVLQVANYLDVSVDFLVGNTDDPYSHKSMNLFQRAYPEFAQAYEKLASASAAFHEDLQKIIEKYTLSADPALESSSLPEDGQTKEPESSDTAPKEAADH